MLGAFVAAIFGGIALAISKGYSIRTNHGMLVFLFYILSTQIIF
jgi:hypothetical protein